MNTSALQKLAAALKTEPQNASLVNGHAIEATDRGLGELKDELTFAIITAMGYMSLRDIAQNGPERGHGGQGLSLLLLGHLLTQWGDKIGEEEIVDVRKHDGKWIVVASPKPKERR